MEENQYLDGQMRMMNTKKMQGRKDLAASYRVWCYMTTLQQEEGGDRQEGQQALRKPENKGELEGD